MMSRRPGARRAARHVVLVAAYLLFLVAGLACLPALARQPDQAVWKTQRNLDAVQAGWEALNNDRQQLAEQRFTELANRFTDPYEKSQAQLGLVQALLERDAVDRAIRLLEQIMQADVLDSRSYFDAMLQLAQLCYSRDRHNEALSWLNRWEQQSGADKPIPAYEIRASIYAHQERYRLALQNIDQAIALSDQPANESWLNLKLAAHHAVQEYRQARDVLRILTARKPDQKHYWINLAQINLTLNNEQQALAALASAQRLGLLDQESEWLQLFSLYAAVELPFQAAQLLQEALDKAMVSANERHYLLLGDAWYSAHELDRSLAALRRATSYSTDGELDLRIAHLLVEQQRYQQAKTALLEALGKGGLSRSEQGRGYVLLGISERNNGQLLAARDAFTQALKFDAVRGTAQQWLRHLEQGQALVRASE